MKVVQFLKWSPLVIAGIFVISSQSGSEFNKPVKLTPEYLKNHKWVAVNENDNPRTLNHQTCKLIFFENHDFEIRKTFEYSGSTFRIPGKYFMQDSAIRLKNLTGNQTIGKAYIFEDYQLRINWKCCHTIYGEGTENFLNEESCSGSSNNLQFTARMLNLFNFK